MLVADTARSKPHDRLKSNSIRSGRTYTAEELFSSLCGDQSVHAEYCIAAHRLNHIRL
jgi:hypothetical protein